MEENGKINVDRLKVYAGDVAKIASAIQSVFRHDGWQIFLAVFQKEKDEIKERKDYTTLEDFKADRKAIDIIESVIETLSGYIADATEADSLLKTLTDPSQTPSKSVLILDSLEEHGREQG